MLTEDLTPEPTTRAHLTTDRKLEVPTTADRTLDPTTTAQLTPVRKTADTTQAPEVGADQLTLDLTTLPTLERTTQDQTLDPVGTQDRILDRTLVPTTHPTLVLTTPDLRTAVPTHPTLDLRTADRTPVPTTADQTPVPTTQPTLLPTPDLITPDPLERVLEQTLDRQPVMEANLDPTTADRTLDRMPESNRAPDPTLPLDLHPTTRVPERLDPATHPTLDRTRDRTPDRTPDRVPVSRARPLVRLVNQERNSR